MTRHPDASAVILDFIQRYLMDQEGCGVRASSDYEILYPGYENVVRKEYALLVSGGSLREPRKGPPEPGSRLGAYELLRRLGSGGQGDVFEARDVRLDRRVALKVVAHLDGDGLRRCRREAEILGTLDHPGICTLLDAGHDAGSVYLVMNLVEGQTLAALIAAARDDTPGPVPIPGAGPGVHGATMACLRLVEQVARAVHVAHEAGVIHRDLKPGNIMVTPERGPVVLDFGLARLQEATDASLSLSGDILGTPAYLPPEHLDGAPVDHRADVWALGVTLHEMLTGRRPFEAPTREALFRRILEDPVRDLRRENRAVTRDLLAVVETALAKDPDRRYRSALAFAEDLAAAAEDRSVAVRRAAPVARLRSWARRHRAAAALVLVLALAIPALAGAGGFLIATWPDQELGRQQRATEEIERRLAIAYADLEDRGSVLEAARAFTELATVPGARIEALAGLAITHFTLLEHAQVVTLLSSLPETLENPGLARVLAYALEARKEPLPNPVQKAAARPLADSVDFFVAGELENLRGHQGERAAFHRAAHLHAESIIRAPRRRAVYHFSRAHALGHCGPSHREEARAAALALLDEWPESTLACYWAAYALRGVDPALAAQTALRGVHADPKHINGIANLGYIELQRGKFAESESWSRKALELDPKNIGALRNLALALRRQRRFEESIEVARRGLELDPTDPKHSLTLGISLGLAGRDAEAADAYRRTLKLSPGDVQAANNLAFILFEQGQRDGEVRDLLRVASVVPGGVPHAALTLARILEAEQAWPEIVEVLERGLVLFAERARGPVRSPSSLQVSILHHLSLALLQCGRLDEAEARAREALSLDPRHTVTILALGNVSVARGHYIEALARYREAVDADPGDAHMASQVAELEKVIRTQVAAERAILAMRSGADPAIDPKLGLEMARLAERRGWHATAARLFELVIARAGADAPLLVLAEAARSAALAGAGEAEECTRLAFEDRARWRRTALEWLERELVAGERGAPSRRVELLEERLVDEAFAALRGEHAQILMPEAEREGWMAYWRAVDEVLERAR